MSVKDITTDLNDGIILINLLEILTNKSFPKYNKSPIVDAQKLDNITKAFEFMEKNLNLRIVGCNANGSFI